MSLLSFCTWLQDTAVSTGIRESTYMFPIIIAIHVMGTATAVGTILALDFRLLGWGMRRFPVSVIFKELRPWSMWGFAVQSVSGLLLFWSEPLKCYKATSFWIKMIAMILAFLNAFIFDKTLYPKVAPWDNSIITPARARFASVASLVLWSTVVFTGRWTAYF